MCSFVYTGRSTWLRPSLYPLPSCLSSVNSTASQSSQPTACMNMFLFQEIFFESVFRVGSCRASHLSSKSCGQFSLFCKAALYHHWEFWGNVLWLMLPNKLFWFVPMDWCLSVVFRDEPSAIFLADSIFFFVCVWPTDTDFLSIIDSICKQVKKPVIK